MSTETQSRCRLIRPGFAVVVTIFLATVFVVLPWILNDGTTGGQLKESPDGKYRIDVSRKLRGKPDDSYSIVLSRAGSNEPIRRMILEPVNGRPEQMPRGSPRAIEWNADSTHADIVLDGERVCRIYVPGR